MDRVGVGVGVADGAFGDAKMLGDCLGDIAVRGAIRDRIVNTLLCVFSATIGITFAERTASFAVCFFLRIFRVWRAFYPKISENRLDFFARIWGGFLVRAPSGR
ncbi:MAG: hypothetical protein K1X71_13660 [Pirellulales bacterium]|nr:hypothetical protein [Pirellulales bacterium]